MDGFSNPPVTQLLYQPLFHPAVYNIGVVIVLASAGREYLNVYFQAKANLRKSLQHLTLYMEDPTFMKTCGFSNSIWTFILMCFIIY